MTIEVAAPPSICRPVAASRRSWAGTVERWSSALARYLPVAHLRSGSGHALVVTGASLFHGYLCLQYEVTPVPDSLQGDETWHEDSAGAAVGNCGVVFRDCHSAYRRSADGSRVVGILTVGPIADPAGGSVVVLFAPMAQAVVIDQPLCELALQVGPEAVDLLSIGWA